MANGNGRLFLINEKAQREDELEVLAADGVGEALAELFKVVEALAGGFFSCGGVHFEGSRLDHDPPFVGGENGGKQQC